MEVLSIHLITGREGSQAYLVPRLEVCIRPSLRCLLGPPSPSAIDWPVLNCRLYCLLYCTTLCISLARGTVGRCLVGSLV